MPIDVKEPNSPGWWLDRLAKKLRDRQPRLQGLFERFEGNGPLPNVRDDLRDSYRTFQKKARTNWPELIVEAPRERMTLDGFRTAAAGDEYGDPVALEIWNGNGLPVESADVHQSMLAAGDGYVIVGGPDRELGENLPIITGEDPRQVVTIHDPRQQRRVRAALKMFHDPDVDRDYAYLYLPGRVYVATRDVRRHAGNRSVRFAPATWDWDDTRRGEQGRALGHDRVPVVRFRNRRGVGEFELHTDLLDRIDHMMLQRLVIATTQAFKQMAIKGLPDEDDEGNEVDWSDVFGQQPGEMWKVPKDVEFWESGAVDLSGILNGAKDDLRQLAAVTRTSLSYLAPDAASQSAEGASLMREGQTFRTEDRIARATEGWKDVMSLAFLTIGDTERAQRGALQPMWAATERLPLPTRADASTKAQDLPWRDRMIHVWGFAPHEVDRMAAERSAETLLAGSLEDEADETVAGLTPVEFKAKTEALGQLIRAGVEPESAAEQVGLSGLAFTGAVPGSLRVPERDAQQLED